MIGSSSANTSKFRQTFPSMISKQMYNGETIIGSNIAELQMKKMYVILIINERLFIFV